MDADNKKPVDAEPAAKGINWLTIFGWAVLAILVVIIIYVLAIYKQSQDNPLVQAATKMEPYITEMKDKTRSQIEDMSQFVDAGQYETSAEPMNAYYSYAGAWVVVEGQISKDMTENVAANVAGNIMSTDENYGAYVLNNNIVVIDIEKGYQDLPEGSTISGAGRLLIVRIEDIWDLPIIGPDLKTEFDALKDMPEGVVFLISKEIKLLDGPSQDLTAVEEPGSGGEPTLDDGSEPEEILGPAPDEDVDGAEHAEGDEDPEGHEGDDVDGEE